MSKKKPEVDAKTFVKSYWNYYLELEQQFSDIRCYVDFNSKNNNTFSMEFLKLLQAVCSEIDVVAKVIDGYVFDDFDGGAIAKWGYYLQQVLPNIQKTTVMFNDDYQVQPWAKWELIKETKNDKNGNPKTTYKLKDKLKHPSWWTAYNKSKHERTSPYNNSNINYNRANLKNVVHSFAALFIMEILFLDYICQKENKSINISHSKLFTLKGVETDAIH